MKQLFQHFKGPFYTVIGIGNHTENRERLVAYTDSDGDVHFRPEEQFFGTVEVDGKTVPRFTRIDSMNLHGKKVNP